MSRRKIFFSIGDRLDVGTGREAFDYEEGSEPTAEQGGDGTASDSEDGDEAGERSPLREPGASEKLA